jgi:hypothetical protein
LFRCPPNFLIGAPHLIRIETIYHSMLGQQVRFTIAGGSSTTCQLSLIGPYSSGLAEPARGLKLPRCFTKRSSCLFCLREPW